MSVAQRTEAWTTGIAAWVKEAKELPEVPPGELEQAIGDLVLENVLSVLDSVCRLDERDRRAVLRTLVWRLRDVLTDCYDAVCPALVGEEEDGEQQDC